jgi:hypothetical protein
MSHSKRDKWESEFDARQRNIQWSEVLRNSSLVEGFAWKGSRNATLVQRVGIGLIALFLPLPILLFNMALDEGLTALGIGLFLLCLPFAGITYKLFRNVFRY